MTVKEYIRRKEILAYTPYRVHPDGKAGRLLEGKLIPEEEFRQMFPLPVTLHSHQGRNADSTRNWLIVE